MIQVLGWSSVTSSCKSRAHEGRYTDEYQRRDGQWFCDDANVNAVNPNAVSA